MKSFLSTFIACLILCVVLMFFFAGFFIGSIWRTVVLIAFLLSLLVTAFMHQDARIEALEKKIAQLQNGDEPRREDDPGAVQP